MPWLPGSGARYARISVRTSCCGGSGVRCVGESLVDGDTGVDNDCFVNSCGYGRWISARWPLSEITGTTEFQRLHTRVGGVNTCSVWARGLCANEADVIFRW